MNPKVDVVVPGATKSAHLSSNLKASGLADLSESQLLEAKTIYDEMIKPHVHHLW